MSDPKNATGKPVARGRVAVLITAVLVAIGLVIWIELSAWDQLGAVQTELADSTADQSDLGLKVRLDLSRLNARLLLFQLSDESAERDLFHREARDLKEWLERTRSSFRSDSEADALQQLITAYESYLRAAASFLDKGVRGIHRGTAGELYREISALSEPLVRLAAALTDAQNADRQSRMAATHGSFAELKRLFQFSLFLVVALLVLTVGLTYRILVAPLQSELSHRRSLIEWQEKLASLGTLAAGVAHEIRNPLTAIKFRLFSLRKALAGHVTDTEDLRIIDAEINRLERIVKDFLQFARPSKPEFAHTSTQQILQEVHALLRAQLERQKIQFSIELGEPIELQADKEQLKQVLIILVQNAADSTDSDGCIQLRARLGASRLGKGTSPMLSLEVTDNGKGIPPEVEARLFDPFFSTKEGGTGLGLPIAARIVEPHGGHIQYQTHPPALHQFRMRLTRSPIATQ